MSYRDIRNFLEHIRALGYPRLVSMESFREPNFKQVAEILNWLVERYDTDAGIPTDVDTEQDRVYFIKAVAQFMATTASVRLNTKKLYRADGNAVKELLKVTTMLYSAMLTGQGGEGEGGGDGDLEHVTMASFDLTTKAKELKDIRSLASEITGRGAQLYDLLRNEVELREERTAALARPLDIDAIEVGLTKSIASVNEQYNHYLGLIDNLSSDETNLAGKIEKKKMELERGQRRLKSLLSVRPAFMDEYQKIEEDLGTKYQHYVDKFRNLTYLEHQLEDIKRREQDKIEETEDALRRMQERLVAEEGKPPGVDLSSDESSLGESDDDLRDLDGDDGVDSDDYGDERPTNAYGERPTAAGGGGGGMGGDLAGGLESDSDSDLDGSLDDSASSNFDDSDDDAFGGGPGGGMGVGDDDLDGGDDGSGDDDF